MPGGGKEALEAAYISASRADAALGESLWSRNDKVRRKRRLGAELYGGGEKEDRGSALTDRDLLREEFEFVREDNVEKDAKTYAGRLARRQYDRLYKEYAIVNLGRYKKGLLGMRWCTEAEVLSGKGRTWCGAEGCDRGQVLERGGKKSDEEHVGSDSAELETYEVPFSYVEKGEKKVTLVKVSLCKKHARRMLKVRKNFSKILTVEECCSTPLLRFSKSLDNLESGRDEYGHTKVMQN